MRIRHIAVAGTAAAALTLGAALPAFAGDAEPSPAVAAHHTADLGALMASKKVKVFQDADYKNRNTTFTEDMWDLSKDGWNDTISSAINQGQRTVTFYSGVKGHGASFSLAPGDREAHFGNRGMPDTTTSVMFR